MRVPVICVGNLTLGGTGKTPLVKWLVRWLTERGVRVAIVSRGYGANGDETVGGSSRLSRSLTATGRGEIGEFNDEALELRQALPGVPHVQNPDRVAAAARAIAEFGCQAIVLDDGFQHRRLARDLDIVLLDALEPFGFDHVFPRGTLRESLVGLQRAHVVCLSRTDLVTQTERAAIRSRVAEIAPNVMWCECAHAASQLVTASGGTEALAALAGRRVMAFCGIGNPAGFRHTLNKTGCQIVAWREFPDHYAFGDGCLDELASAAADCDAELVVCTQKDLVKLGRVELAGRPVWALAIEMKFFVGQEQLEIELARTVQQPLN
jgi:tetraacyldisaccharide 4'-kinase